MSAPGRSGDAGRDAEPEPAAPVGGAAAIPSRAAEDTDSAWGDWREGADSNDDRLLRERPPHWG